MPAQPNSGHNSHPAPEPLPENFIPITHSAPSGGNTGTPATFGFNSGTRPPGPPARPNTQLRMIILHLAGQIEEQLKAQRSNDALVSSYIHIFYENTRDNRLGRIMDKVAEAATQDQTASLRITEILEHLRRFASEIR